MDTVVDRLIRYAKVYSESDYHAGRAVTPSTQRQFDMGRLCLPHRAVNICPPSA